MKNRVLERSRFVARCGVCEVGWFVDEFVCDRFVCIQPGRNTPRVEINTRVNQLQRTTEAVRNTKEN